MYCKYCGKKVSDQVKFCPYCGKALKSSKKIIDEKIMKETKEPERAPVKAPHKEIHYTREQIEQNQERSIKKKSSNKTHLIIASCVIALVIGSIGIGVTMINNHSLPFLSSNKSSKEKDSTVLVAVIDHIKYYSGDGNLTKTSDFHYNDLGLIDAIDSHGDSLNDNDEETLTYKNHRLISIHCTCPSGKDDVTNYKYNYAKTGHHYIISGTKQVIPRSNSETQKTTMYSTLM